MRAKMVETLRQEFADLDFTYSIGGQISFDVRLLLWCPMLVGVRGGCGSALKPGRGGRRCSPKAGTKPSACATWRSLASSTFSGTKPSREATTTRSLAAIAPSVTRRARPLPRLVPPARPATRRHPRLLTAATGAGGGARRHKGAGPKAFLSTELRSARLDHDLAVKNFCSQQGIWNLSKKIINRN